MYKKTVLGTNILPVWPVMRISLISADKSY